MDSDRYIKKIERFYDQYVDLYNAEKSKLKAFSELSNICSGLKEIKRQKKSRIKEKSETMIELFLVAWIYETNDKELTFQECLEVTNDMNSEALESAVNNLLNDVHGIKSIDQTRKEIISELNELFNYSDKGQIPYLMDTALEQLKELQILTPNLHALLNLMEKIVSLEYPETVNKFNQLSDKDQSDITRVGRPLNKDLPQNQIVNFVKSKLFPSGKKTDNKKFIHQTGVHEGNPNWKQLSELYLSEYPEIEEENIISQRRLKDRIKMAYEEIIKSMK